MSIDELRKILFNFFGKLLPDCFISLNNTNISTLGPLFMLLSNIPNQVQWLFTTKWKLRRILSKTYSYFKLLSPNL